MELTESVFIDDILLFSTYQAASCLYRPQYFLSVLCFVNVVMGHMKYIVL